MKVNFVRPQNVKNGMEVSFGMLKMGWQSVLSALRILKMDGSKFCPPSECSNGMEVSFVPPQNAQNGMEVSFVRPQNTQNGWK